MCLKQVITNNYMQIYDHCDPAPISCRISRLIMRLYVFQLLNCSLSSPEQLEWQSQHSSTSTFRGGRNWNISRNIVSKFQTGRDSIPDTIFTHGNMCAFCSVNGFRPLHRVTRRTWMRYFEYVLSISHSVLKLIKLTKENILLVSARPFICPTPFYSSSLAFSPLSKLPK